MINTSKIEHFHKAKYASIYNTIPHFPLIVVCPTQLAGPNTLYITHIIVMIKSIRVIQIILKDWPYHDKLMSTLSNYITGCASISCYSKKQKYNSNAQFKTMILVAVQSLHTLFYPQGTIIIRSPTWSIKCRLILMWCAFTCDEQLN